MPGRFYEDFFIFSGAPLAKLGELDKTRRQTISVNKRFAWDKFTLEERLAAHCNEQYQ